MTKSFFTALLLLLLNHLSYGQVDDSKIKISSTSNGREEAAIYSRLLQESYQNGAYELQKTYSDSLLLISELYGITEMSILALNSQAVYYKNISNRKKALEIYHTALKKCDLVADNKGPKAMILVNMGNVYTSIGSYEKSTAAMDTLLLITDTIKRFSKIKAAALVGQSTNYLELNNHQKSLDYAQKAIDLGTQMNDDTVLGTALNNISDIYIKEEQYSAALENTQRGLELSSSKTQTKKRASLLLNNGIANYHLSALEKAITSLEEALQISQDKNLYEIEMHCYEYLAKIFEEKGAFEKSYEAQKEYSSIRETIQSDKKETAIKELERDITATQETLNATKKETYLITKISTNLKIYGGMVLLILCGLLFFFIRKKKYIELENQDLKKKFILLKQRTENTTFDTASTISKAASGEQKPYQNSALTDQKRQAYKKHIIQLMREDKPYLKPDLRLTELAATLEMSTSHFSEVLHYCFKENFYNFINFYRVIEAQDLLKNASYSDEKIITVAFDAGFKSKTTFNRVFKSYTGLTPSEYRKHHS